MHMHAKFRAQCRAAVSTRAPGRHRQRDEPRLAPYRGDTILEKVLNLVNQRRRGDTRLDPSTDVKEISA